MTYLFSCRLITNAPPVLAVKLVFAACVRVLVSFARLFALKLR